jgi:hypothetical protein
LWIDRLSQGVRVLPANGVADAGAAVQLIRLVRSFITAIHSVLPLLTASALFARLTIFQLSPQSSSSRACIVPLNGEPLLRPSGFVPDAANRLRLGSDAGYQSLMAAALLPLLCAGLLMLTYLLEATIAWLKGGRRVLSPLIPFEIRVFTHL